MMKVPWRAMERAVAKLRDKYDEGAEADAGFDAGEFSGPALDRMYDKDEERLLVKYGWSLDELSDARETAAHDAISARSFRGTPA